MLRQAFARKVCRMRSARALTRNMHNPSPSSIPLPTLSAPLATPGPANFPLYRPPPKPEHQKLPQSLDGLPSEASIKRQMKAIQSEEAIRGMPELKEEDIRDFYKALVLSGAPVDETLQVPLIEAPTQPMRRKERVRLLQELSGRLEAQKVESGETSVAVRSSLPAGTALHVALTAELIDVVPESEDPLNIPLGLVRNSEWRALLETFLSKGDARGAEAVLTLMQRHGTTPSTNLIDAVLSAYSRSGQVNDVARLLHDLEKSGLEVEDRHRDALIQAVLVSGGTDAAISLLVRGEKNGATFPQSSYNTVLVHLTEGSRNFVPDAHSRALALDVFAQMRFAAHPQPSRELYTTMIESFAHSVDPQPERALDLWLEMIDAGIEPRGEQYNAIIRALGSTRGDYLQAYDLLRQMLAKHTEATFVPFAEEGAVAATSPWVPSLDTFRALMAGTKRAGDLSRARWVLNEIVDLAATSAFQGDGGVLGPDEDLLTSVFQTYTAWKPPIARHQVKLGAAKKAEELAEPSEDAAEPTPEPHVAVHEEDWSNGSAMPKTNAEALFEAQVVFGRVISDIEAKRQDPSVTPLTHPFCGAKLTDKLVNGYLSVVLHHAANVAEARKLYDTTWLALADGNRHLTPNGFTYLMVLDRVGRGKIPRDERAAARAWGWDIWNEYLAWSEATMKYINSKEHPVDSPLRMRYALGLDDRTIERTWVRAIKLAASDRSEKGMELVREFLQRYPPRDILDSYTPLAPHQDLRIRMTMEGDVGEPNVPPHLLFEDVKLLHQVLVRDERVREINELNRIVKGYQHALQKRRRWRVTGAGVRRQRQWKDAKRPQSVEWPAAEMGMIE